MNDRNDKYWNNRGLSSHQLGIFEDSIRDYLEALKLNDKNADYWNNRGSSNYKLKKYEDAIKDHS